ncbi:single-stranded-DNA-specific exonuclease RecJ [Helicobacter anseris]|uniref:Single-stranded-DNA-specific exonuclease RecJ n=1 Tax=Helicobacter anseris TaxID=375926 RepID=A0A3D8J6L1_9HELI|nr:single-stranded-DNA-specific exonuclease RecJ [Helicobacter anseris]RDU72835.1 single-stranded-DNA-specific exonuclease RecJ [Helicobacter anseris]
MHLLTKETIKLLLSKRFKGDNFSSLKDLPHPHKLKDAQKAAQIVKEAMQANHKILVVGDYDVDGVLSTTIMMSFFQIIGYKNVNYCIPNRFSDGYGIKPHLIEQNPCDVIITVDNGISAFEVGEYCKNKNIKLIITDHHETQEKLPLADAIINPQQIDCDFIQKNICGAGVAWYFCNAIKIALDLKISLLELLKYVAIATIADMMPLTHINKILVKKGIEVFRNSNNQCDLLLKTFLKSQKFTAQDISFFITPLLNSAGRIADAKIVCDFFLSQSKEETKEIFYKLQSLNQERKDIVQTILTESKHHITQTSHCIIAYKDDWNEGVLGIIATKLVEIYQKPTFVFTLKNQILKGSGRSDGKIDIFQTLLHYQELFLHFGGHSQAIGLSLPYENLNKFCDIFASNHHPLTQQENTAILGQIELKEINKDLLNLLQSFEPYGQGNLPPQFLIKNLTISQSKSIKDMHQKLVFENQIDGMHFFSKDFFASNEKVDIIACIQESLYSKTPMLLIKEISKCPL